MVPRPEVMKGATYKVATPVGSAFITVNNDDEGNPIEVFVNIGKAGSDLTAMATALGRMASTLLRLNSAASPRQRAEELVSQLSGIGGRRSIGFGQNRIYSLPDAVAQALRRHLLDTVRVDKEAVSSPQSGGDTTVQAEAVMAALNPDPTPASAEVQFTTVSELDTVRGADICPVCGVMALVHEEGCAKCYACGHAEC